MAKRQKPGPKEEVHTLHPLTFGQALGKMLAAKPPPKREPAPKRKARKKRK
jgi:hypothetical protein